MKLRRAAAVLALMVLAMLAGAPQASALPDVLGCTDAPTPEVPGRGITGFFESRPAGLPPVDANPFAPNSTTTIYETYGYAGLRWNTYDLGCGPDLARSPDAAIGTAVANWLMLLPKAGVALTSSTLGAASDAGILDFLDPLISRVVDGLRAGMFERWYWVPLCGLGILLIWRSRQQKMNDSAKAVGWAVLVMVLATMLFRWPLTAGHTTDQTITAVLSGVNAGMAGKNVEEAGNAGTEVAGNLHEAVLYQAWLGGTFGSADSAVAREYGPVIFDATALTWAQEATLQKDPEAGRAIIEAKKDAFEAAASKIKEADPDAYDYLTGRRSDTRVGYALLSGLAALCAIPFLFMAALLILGARLIVRFGAMLFPAIATFGLFPTMRSVVTSTGSTMVAAIINSLLFGTIAAVDVLIFGAILIAPMPAWLHVVLMLLVTVISWYGSRPFRKLTQMASGQHVFSEAMSGPGRLARTAAGAAMTGLSLAVKGAVGAMAVSKGVEHGIEESGPPQRAEAQPDQYVIHTAPPPVSAAPEPPVVIVASTHNLPTPDQPAITSRSEQVPAEMSEPSPALPPARAEASDTSAYDWDAAYRNELSTPEETR